MLVKITFGEYTLYCNAGLPTVEQYATLCNDAQIVNDFGAAGNEHDYLVTVRKGADAPFLVVHFAYSQPNDDAPEFLFIPETHLLFIGADHFAAAYKLDKPKKLWSYAMSERFLSLTRQGEFILIAGMRQLGAWDIYGWKKWLVDIQSPWEYHIQSHHVQLTHGGSQMQFPLDIGPLELMEED